ncbi:MAG: hypothetical protein KBF32_13710 [Chitinophagales bacterium]|nr:hypothetical protein [Chitinophagales bacterium]
MEIKLSVGKKAGGISLRGSFREHSLLLYQLLLPKVFGNACQQVLLSQTMVNSPCNSKPAQFKEATIEIINMPGRIEEVCKPPMQSTMLHDDVNLVAYLYFLWLKRVGNIIS